jgi:hypothetical protein
MNLNNAFSIWNTLHEYRQVFDGNWVFSAFQSDNASLLDEVAQ